MSKRTGRVHYFHADANALGGHVERPFRENIPSQASLSLPPVGGFDSAHTENFRLHEILSARSARSQVAGSVNPETGTPTTMSTSVVEDLNVLHILKADRVVGQISAEHPRDGFDPKVSFLGTQIENLRIGGQLVDVILDVDIFDHGKNGKFPKQPCVKDDGFLKKIGQRYDDKRGFILCTLVKDIKGKFPGSFDGKNVLDIPELGRVHLAELLVHRTSYQLIMMRLELGCPTQASVSVAADKVNGTGGGP